MSNKEQNDIWRAHTAQLIADGVLIVHAMGSVGRREGVTTVCRTCGSAMADTWPPRCHHGCERVYAPGCLCGLCMQTTPDPMVCGPVWALRSLTMDDAWVRGINELRGNRKQPTGER